ncbi:MAG: MarR family transcriptional regulator [Planctomycetota bacterium]|nr:MAG: MarR family transcriptional regulator [Planctomycetota bacterium]
MMPNRLQEEIKKKQPFESLEQEAMLNLLRTADRFSNRFGKFFRQFGLTSSQYNILRILRGEGAPLPSLEIAQRMIQAVPAITGLIDRLEAAGLVQRQRSTSDRRVVFVRITPQGRSLLRRIDGPLMELHEACLGHLSHRELRTLIRLLEKAREALDESPE